MTDYPNILFGEVIKQRKVSAGLGFFVIFWFRVCPKHSFKTIWNVIFIDVFFIAHGSAKNAINNYCRNKRNNSDNYNDNFIHIKNSFQQDNKKVLKQLKTNLKLLLLCFLYRYFSPVTVGEAKYLSAN